jgi:predicted Zn-dependent protease
MRINSQEHDLNAQPDENAQEYLTVKRKDIVKQYGTNTTPNILEQTQGYDNADFENFVLP